MDNYFNGPALFVKQPFREFYIISIPATKLVNICYSFPAIYGEELLNGVQRGLNDKRISNIAEFSKTENALFPNSIILSANILPDGTSPEEECWYLDGANLVIPSDKKYASIVDGQHRLAGLKKAIESGDIDETFSVVCAVYFKLTAPEQAEVFATINFNQQKVDKSLAYQLFGYDLDADEKKYWAPDTLAIYYSRLLNKMEESPFFNRVNYGMAQIGVDENIDWSISTSSLVEGITSLFSSNPTSDRYEIHKKKLIRNERDCLKIKSNSPPLRQAFIDKKDKSIFDLILNYFKKWSVMAWQSENTLFMRKTIGIQASFDILKDLCNMYGLDQSAILERLDDVNLNKLGNVEVNYSGIGRSQIRNELRDQLNLN